jgi:hypothetical protein
MALSVMSDRPVARRISAVVKIRELGTYGTSSSENFPRRTKGKKSWAALYAGG